MDISPQFNPFTLLVIILVAAGISGAFFLVAFSTMGLD